MKVWTLSIDLVTSQRYAETLGSIGRILDRNIIKLLKAHSVIMNPLYGTCFAGRMWWMRGLALVQPEKSGERVCPFVVFSPQCSEEIKNGHSTDNLRQCSLLACWSGNWIGKFILSVSSCSRLKLICSAYVLLIETKKHEISGIAFLVVGLHVVPLDTWKYIRIRH